MCSLLFENNFLTIEGVRFASISKKTPLTKLSFAFVSLALPLLVYGAYPLVLGMTVLAKEVQANRDQSASSSCYNMLPPVWYVYGAYPHVLGMPALAKDFQASRSRSAKHSSKCCLLYVMSMVPTLVFWECQFWQMRSMHANRSRSSSSSRYNLLPPVCYVYGAYP